MDSELINLVQWPAMAVTVGASWLVASSRPGRRRLGFWLFLLSNLLWVGWGLHTGAQALIVLQFCLAALNIRGAKKTEDDKRQAEADKVSRQGGSRSPA